MSSTPTSATSSRRVPSATISPVVDDPDPVAQALGLLHVVGRVEDRHALARRGARRLEDRVAALRVDADRRLVEDQQPGPVEQRRSPMFSRRFMPPRVGLRAILRPGPSGPTRSRTSSTRPRGAAPPSPYSRPKNARFSRAGQVRVEGELLRHVADAPPWPRRAPTSSGRPSTVTCRASGVSSPQTIEIVVVLPAPFGPSRPYVSPSRISKETPWTASRSPIPLAQVDGREDHGAHPAGRGGALQRVDGHQVILPAGPRRRMLRSCPADGRRSGRAPQGRPAQCAGPFVPTRVRPRASG